MTISLLITYHHFLKYINFSVPELDSVCLFFFLMHW